MSGNNLGDREHDDSDVSSLFSGRSTTTAPTEWSASDGTRSEADSDLMSVMSSVYVFFVFVCREGNYILMIRVQIRLDLLGIV